MNTGHSATASLDQPADLREPGSALRRWWTIIAALLVAAIFAQAVFAGLMLSGVDWALKAHSLNAALLLAATLAAGFVSLATLRRVAQGWKFALTLLSLAAAIFVQMAIGAMSAKGANLMWLHVPLGVALVGFAAQALVGARRLGNPK